jgi:ribosomal protein S27AE
MKEFDLETATPEELRKAVAGLSIELEKALEKIAQLEQKLQELEKKKGTSAAPFSKGERQAKPKRPGRQAGQGPFTRRAAPTEEELSETLQVSLDDRSCPRCGAQLTTPREFATTTDIPEVIKPIIRGFSREVGTCVRCGHRVRARHRQLAEDQYGASAHRLGPGVVAQALTLHYHHGLPLRKVPGVIAAAFGIELTQSALTQTALKLASEDGVVGQAYHRWSGLIEQAPAVNTDDTGWQVGGEKAQLMAFTTPQTAMALS